VAAAGGRATLRAATLTRMPPRRPLVPEDILRQVVVEEHDLSRDGRIAVVARRSVRGRRYVSHLWTVPLDDAAGTRGSRVGRTRAITSGLVRDGWPRLSPDGRTVAFIRRLPADEDAPDTIGLVPSAGGPVHKVRRGEHGGIGEVAWSPDGARMAFTAEVDPPRFLVGSVPPVGKKPRKGVTVEAPLARRITRIDWRWDGSGHSDRWSHLFVVEARPGAVPRQVTAGDWGVSQVAWSPDGRTVLFTSDRGPDPDLHPRTTIWAVDVDAATRGATAEPREVLAPAGMANHASPSPDGRWIAAVGIMDAEPFDSLSPGIVIGPADGSGPPIALAPDLDRPVGNWVDTDLNGWMVDGRPGPSWLGDDRVVAVVTDRGRSHPWVFGFDARSGRPTGGWRMVDGDRTVHSLAVSATGRVSWLGTEGARAMELSTIDGDDARVRTRTTIGSAWQRRHPLPDMRVIEVPGSAGPIETWIASPPDAGDGPLPTVVDVHGGPLGAWTAAPHMEVALLVARGFRVILPNIRGSASYGADWIEPQLGDWGGCDADDVHSALDHVISLGLTDPDRIGILGLSYGGFMVNWMVGTTNRFKAAISENGVTNQVSDYANSDSGPEYVRASKMGDTSTAEGVEKLWRQSPLAHVADVRTPLLMFQAEADLRCPAYDNEQFFIALRVLGRTVEYVLYPEEYHVYSSSGRPDRRVDRQNRMLDWFDRYLKG
jgi:dipeptidyl aminopeptidase/acylaminoacyl peptidase